VKKVKTSNLFVLLGRITTSWAVIPEIDGLRFLAIISVVIFHLRTNLLRTTPFKLSLGDFSQTIFDFISNGGFGVNVFFGISGFILAIPFAKQHLESGRTVNLKSYYLRRLTRLEPPYIITMTIFLFAIVLMQNKSFHDMLPNYFASLIYSHFFIYGEWSVINPVAWSLETEVQFYLLAPLFFLIFKVRDKNFRQAIIVMAMVIFTVLTFIFHDIFVKYHLYKSILVYLPYFTVGVLFADIYLIYLRNNVEKKSYIWDLIGIAATITMFSINANNNPLSTMISLVCVVLVFFTAFKGKLLNRFYTLKFIYTTGGMCYTIYLLHYAFIAVIMSFTSRIGSNGDFIINFMIQCVIILPLLFLVSSIFFVLFEKPFMYKDWPSRFSVFFGKLRSVKN